MYQVLIDYGGYEGMRFMDGQYNTVDEAVKAALVYNSAFKFLVVKVINWEAKSNE